VVLVESALGAKLLYQKCVQGVILLTEFLIRGSMDYKRENEGYIYCLTNPSMPGIVKIGMTHEEPEDRAAELSSVTGVPTPFDVALSKRVLCPVKKEADLHNLLSALGFRVNERREFFTCSLTIVGLLFALIDGTDLVVGDGEAVAVRHVKAPFTVQKIDG